MLEIQVDDLKVNIIRSTSHDTSERNFDLLVDYVYAVNEMVQEIA